ncbi:MAG: PD40 domain-containing protein [Flavobacteriales bacterium]|nr:PD40 domain-containing protein [Flavobacteriales bacterium]
MLIFKEDQSGNGNLFITTREGDGFETPIELEETINSKNHEISATISADGNTIIFASDRKGGRGGTDLYISKKLPIGGWGPSKTIGPLVNTEFDEDFPNLSPDGKILYFSSKGHVSMGGYDIFKAEWNGETKHYGNVRSIGYPINTPYDDMNFRVSDNGRYSYLAAIRQEGQGDMDIYRVIFNKIEPNYTVISGYIKTDDTNNRAEDAFLSITDIKTGDIVGDYLPNLRNMKYVMILPPGEYNLYIEAAGFHSVSEDINILDKSSFTSEMLKNFTLKKL